MKRQTTPSHWWIPRWPYHWEWQTITVFVWLWDHRRKSSEGSHYGGRVSCVDCRWGIYHQFILIVVKIVSEKCGITGHHLFNRPTFTTVFNNLIHWIETCVTEAWQSGILYYPGIDLLWALWLFYSFSSFGSTQRISVWLHLSCGWSQTSKVGWNFWHHQHTICWYIIWH